jgi:hypothetical protein
MIKALIISIAVVVLGWLVWPRRSYTNVEDMERGFKEKYDDLMAKHLKERK